MMPQKQKQTKAILSGSSSSNTRRPPLNKLSKEKNLRECQVLNRSWLWLMWTGFAVEGLSRGRAERPGLGSLTPESQSWPCWLPNLLFHFGQVPFCLWSWVLVCEMRVGGALPAQKSSVAGVVVMSRLHHLVALQSQVGVPADLAALYHVYRNVICNLSHRKVERHSVLVLTVLPPFWKTS